MCNTIQMNKKAQIHLFPFQTPTPTSPTRWREMTNMVVNIDSIMMPSSGQFTGNL